MPTPPRKEPNAELVIFDCDGVLVDSEPPANRAMTQALAEVGLEWSYEEVCRRFIGLSMARVVELVEHELRHPLPERWLEDLQRRTFEAFRRELTPVRGVEEVLDALDRPYCVASSGEFEKMRLTLGKTGLLARFEGRMFSATQVARGKPAPDLFLWAAERMETRPARCVVVEDSLPGVLAAQAAGMRVIGYSGSGFGEAIAEAGAPVIDAMGQLMDRLEL